MEERGVSAVIGPGAPRPAQRRFHWRALPWSWLLFALAATLALPAPAAVAWQQATETGAAVTSDPELEAAWVRAGCALNPGNPSCVIIGHAAACAKLPGDPDCTADRDGDRCRDVAEVRAGLDPLDSADCIGDASGAPLLNCLFLIGNERCDGSPGAAPDAPPRETPPPRDAPPPVDCPPRERDPGCDGFAPETGQAAGPSRPERA